MIPPTKRFDIFLTDWGMLRRSVYFRYSPTKKTSSTIIINIIVPFCGRSLRCLPYLLTMSQEYECEDISIRRNASNLLSIPQTGPQTGGKLVKTVQFELFYEQREVVSSSQPKVPGCLKKNHGCSEGLDGFIFFLIT